MSTCSFVVSPWISASEAARRLGFDRRRVRALAGRGLLPTRTVDGGRTKFFAPAVEALARESIKGN